MDGFRQDDLLSYDLFNFDMESVQKCVQLLAYADNIDIIGCTEQDVTAAFSTVEREYIKMDLAVNEGKRKHVPLIGSHTIANSYTFDVIKEFIYLGSAVTT